MKTSIVKAVLAFAALASALTIWSAVPSKASTIVDSINASSPLVSGSYNTTDIGFLYTPSFSYTLDGVATMFGSSDGRTVTIGIYSGLPPSLTLLGSGGLTPVANTFVTAPFAPLALTQGTTYLLSFENVQNLLPNITGQGPQSLTFFIDSGFSTGPLFQQGVGPVVQFFGETAEVPAPAALPLYGTGLGLMGLFGWWRKRKAAARLQT